MSKFLLRRLSHRQRMQRVKHISKTGFTGSAEVYRVCVYILVDLMPNFLYLFCFVQ